MTITGETLELAALAAGLTYLGDHWSSLARASDGVWQSWRPHTDIADAARLAVRLRMEAAIRAWHASAACGAHMVTAQHDGTDADAERAYCVAVTICAAEIGRRMREGGR